MEFAALSDIGRHRQNNEDDFFVYQNEYLTGGMVADGMGGHKAGETASKMAVDIIKNHIICNFDSKMDYMEVAEMIRSAFFVANREIYRKSQEEEFRGMGTTATLAMVYDNKLIIVHIGDSRCYLLNKDGIKQLTNDHSYVGELLRSGQITELDAKYHPQKNLITKALGAESIPKLDITIEAYNKSTVILCTDGLSNMISDKQITDILNENEELDCAVEKMVELANKKGGNDNITLIVFR